MKIGGSYVSDLPSAFEHSHRIGATAIQFYNGDKQLTTLRTKFPLTIAQRFKPDPLVKVIHSMLRTNLCLDSDHPRNRWNLQNVSADFAFASAIGAIGVVIHVPHLRTKRDLFTKTTCLRHFIRNIQAILSIDPHPFIIIETVHTSKDKLGGSIDEIAAFYRKIPIKLRDRIRFCIDTAHIFAWGYPIHTADGMDAYFTRWDRQIGLDRIALIHCNDSQVGLSTVRDLHAGLGQGYIFGSDKGGSLEALRRLVEYADRHGWPMILETPDMGKYGMEVECVRELLDYRYLCMERLNDMQTYYETLPRRMRNVSDRYRADQYEKAVEQLRTSRPIRSVADVDKMEVLSEGMREKCREIIRRGVLQQLPAYFYPMRELTGVYGVGPEMADRYIAAGITTLSALRRQKDLSRTVRLGLKYYDDLRERVPRVEQETFAQEFLQGYEYRIAGSYYKGRLTSSDIDIVILDKDQDEVIQQIYERIRDRGQICEKMSRTVLFAQVVEGGKVRHIDIRTTPKGNLMYYMFFFTSGKVFNKGIRRWAKRQGYKLTEKGLFRGDERVRGIRTERDIFRILKHPYVAITDR